MKTSASATGQVELSTLANRMKALGDETRLGLMLSVAASSCHDGACICDLTPETSLAQSTISHHMKILVDAGLLNRTQKGKWAYFTLTPEGADLLMSFKLGPLTPVACTDSCTN